MADGKDGTVGTLKWAVYDAATSRLLANGEKTLQTSDVKIRRIQKDLYDKKIELGDHFSFGLADSADRDKTAYGGGDGFGLTGGRDDEQTFSWDWFVVDRSGHANKLQESGELSFDTKKTRNRTEINHMKFLTDVSIRVSRMSDPNPLIPAWRIKIFKGWVVSWPSLLNGEAHTLPDGSS
jgi:hypothetical protein